MSDLLTPAEAAQRLRMSERTLRNIKKRGEIAYVMAGERKLFYRSDDCDAYIASRVRKDVPVCQPAPKMKAPAKRRGNIIPFSQMARG